MKTSRQPSRAVIGIAVGVHEKLRWSFSDVCAVIDLSENNIRGMIQQGGFPPPVRVGEARLQFLPEEVKAWAAGRDWKAIVAQRHHGAEAVA